MPCTVGYKRLRMPSLRWKPFGFGSAVPRRFPRVRRGNKRQPLAPLKEWKLVRGDSVSSQKNIKEERRNSFCCKVQQFHGWEVGEQDLCVRVLGGRG